MQGTFHLLRGHRPFNPLHIAAANIAPTDYANDGNSCLGYAYSLLSSFMLVIPCCFSYFFSNSPRQVRLIFNCRANRRGAPLPGGTIPRVRPFDAVSNEGEKAVHASKKGGDMLEKKPD